MENYLSGWILHSDKRPPSSQTQNEGLQEAVSTWNHYEAPWPDFTVVSIARPVAHKGQESGSTRTQRARWKSSNMVCAIAPD